MTINRISSTEHQQVRVKPKLERGSEKKRSLLSLIDDIQFDNKLSRLLGFDVPGEDRDNGK